MTRVPIAKRARFENIKSVWANECDFSDWLTSQEGIDLLADSVEFEIENPEREVKGTEFKCDVVANVVGDENHVHVVVIECQFGRTNHDHLAKLLTYAAVHEAKTAIWIAEDAADDHRKVIDWLNEKGPENMAFYLAELKGYTIGTSPVAPVLELVCRPNVAMKPSGGGRSERDEERRNWRREFWQYIQERMRRRQLPFRLQRPGPDHWSSIAVGRSGFQVNMLLTPRNESVAVEVVVQPRGWKGEAFEQLLAQRSAIENEIGRELDWRPMVDKGSSRIVLEEGLDPSIDSNRERVADWFAEVTPRLFLAFQERVRRLKAPGD